MKIFFIMRHLGYGGAQRQLIQVANELAKRDFQVSLAAFYTGGALEHELDIQRVRFVDLGKRSRWDLVPFLWRLGRTLWKQQPAVVHGYTRTGNLASLLARLASPRARVVWGVRDSNMDITNYGWPARLADRLACFCSRFADAIIVNSQAGIDYCQTRGYPRSRMIYVPNGIDTARFRPDVVAGAALRAEWSVNEDEFVIGTVGRVDPMKDQLTFLRAGAILRETLPVRLACVGMGDGDSAYETLLRQTAHSLGLDDAMLWIPFHNNLTTVYNALDVFCSSSSYGEGFPNVVGEAMACGTPCVVTDVGDSASVVGDVGIVVPPQQPPALAEAVGRLLVSDRGHYREAAPQRIAKEFSLDALTTRTSLVLQQCVEQGSFGALTSVRP